MAWNTEITLRNADAATDIRLYPLPVASIVSTVIFLVALAGSPPDIILRDPTVAPGGGSFPTQYDGLRIWDDGVAKSLCLVATADAPTGMGGQLRLHKNSTTYAVYLVDTTDPNASAVRIQTTTGIKSIRLKT